MNISFYIPSLFLSILVMPLAAYSQSPTLEQRVANLEKRLEQDRIENEENTKRIGEIFKKVIERMAEMEQRPQKTEASPELDYLKEQRAAIKRFSQAPSLVDKFTEARNLGTDQLTFDEMSKTGLSDQEVTTLKEASNLAEKTRAEAIRFERALTKQDIDRITESYHDSTYRLLGKFSLSSLDTQQLCSKKEFQKLLKAEPSLVLLEKRLTDVAALNHAQEFSLMPTYIKVLGEIAKEKGFSQSLIAYYEATKQIFGDRPSDWLERSIDRSHKALQFSGLDLSQIDTYVKRLKLASPACAGLWNPQIQEYLAEYQKPADRGK